MNEGQDQKRSPEGRGLSRVDREEQGDLLADAVTGFLSPKRNGEAGEDPASIEESKVPVAPESEEAVVPEDEMVGQLVDVDVVVVPDVRSGADVGDAGLGSLPAHGDSVGKVGRAIVQAGKQVAVQVDHVALGRHARSVGPRAAEAPTVIVRDLLSEGE